ncbi:MAG: sarcosine oxidase subunit delta [Pseudomonadota bacterium]
MQRFLCPFCGERDETEFHFGAEAGRHRPEPADRVDADAWYRYLHAQAAPRGPAREVWVHLSCGEFFLMERDTVTREVLGSSALPGREP